MVVIVVVVVVVSAVDQARDLVDESWLVENLNVARRHVQHARASDSCSLTWTRLPVRSLAVLFVLCGGGCWVRCCYYYSR